MTRCPYRTGSRAPRYRSALPSGHAGPHVVEIEGVAVEVDARGPGRPALDGRRVRLVAMVMPETAKVFTGREAARVLDEEARRGKR